MGSWCSTDDRLSYESWVADSQWVSRIQDLVDKDKEVSLPCVILPNLYLGDRASAEDVAKLEELGIRTIIDVGASVNSTTRQAKRLRYQLACEDDEDYPLIPKHAKAISKLISKSLTAPVLIHCGAGINRSPALVVAYLILEQKLDLLTAINTVATVRGLILTNKGFQLQLLQLARKSSLLI